MKSMRVSRRVLAAGALSAILALSYVDSALAGVCTMNTYYDGTTKTGSGGTVFDAANDCLACPTGTTSAATPNGSAATYCEGIAAAYYGTAGSVASAHATVTACPTGFSDSSASSTSVGRETCKKTVSASTPGDSDTFTTSTNTEHFACPENTYNLDVPVAGVASFCKGTNPNFYGTQGTDGHASSVTACPANSESMARSDAVNDCSCSTGYVISSTVLGTCVAATPAAADSAGAATPAAADSAGAAMPIAAAVAAVAMPLLI